MYTVNADEATPFNRIFKLILCFLLTRSSTRCPKFARTFLASACANTLTVFDGEFDTQIVGVSDLPPASAQ